MAKRRKAEAKRNAVRATFLAERTERGSPAEWLAKRVSRRALEAKPSARCQGEPAKRRRAKQAVTTSEASGGVGEAVCPRKLSVGARSESEWLPERRPQ